MTPSDRWPLERVLFALAGTMTLLSAGLAAALSPWFLLLTAFVGVNQWLYVLVGACPASVVLRRACRLRSAVYTDAAQGGDGVMPHPQDRTDRPYRPLHRDSFPGGGGRLARRRGRARFLRAARRDCAFRRRLGDDRLAVGAGPQSDRQELPRAVELCPDDRDLLADDDSSAIPRSKAWWRVSSGRCAPRRRSRP